MSKGIRKQKFTNVVVLKVFAKSTEKALWWSLFYAKLQTWSYKFYQNITLCCRCFTLNFTILGGAAVLQNTSGWLLLMEGEEVWSYASLEKYVFISLERFIVVWKFFLIFQTLDKFLNQGSLKNLVLGTWK